MNARAAPAQFRAPPKPMATDVNLEHPDSEILEAFEGFRRHRVWAYAKEDINRGTWPEGEAERIAAEDLRFELGVTGNFANTPAGVAAQLMVLVPSMEQDRSVDRMLMEGGFLALHRQTKGFDGSTKIVMNAIDELLHIEWEQALAAYEQSERDIGLVRSINTLMNGEEYRTRGRADPGPLVDGLGELRSQIEDRLSDGAVARLLHTLTPDLAAYRRKAAIAIAQDLATEAGPWMVRDVNYLMGELHAGSGIGSAPHSEAE